MPFNITHSHVLKRLWDEMEKKIFYIISCLIAPIKVQIYTENTFLINLYIHHHITFFFFGSTSFFWHLFFPCKGNIFQANSSSQIFILSPTFTWFSRKILFIYLWISKASGCNIGFKLLYKASKFGGGDKSIKSTLVFKWHLFYWSWR